MLADSAEVQGRVIEGPWYSVTASIDAMTNINDVRLGDLVTSGDVIATQDSAKLELQLKKRSQGFVKLSLNLLISRLSCRLRQNYWLFLEAQASLLADKAKRAEGLVANNALAADAAEMAYNASMTANLSLTRQSSIARKKVQQKILRVTIDQIKDEIIQLVNDIKATKLRTEIDGQITFIADYRRGFARQVRL